MTDEKPVGTSPFELDGYFEPGSEFLSDNDDVRTHAIVSAAISLKRIADSLSYSEEDNNLFDLLYGIRNNIRK